MLNKHKRNRRNNKMADPILISTVVGLIGRIIDKKKPLGKTNIATGTGVTLGGVALALIQTPAIESQIAGYVLGLVSIGLTFYKESTESK